MKIVRHGRPLPAYINTLRKATDADFQSLVTAVVEALIRTEKDVWIAFAYVFKFPEDFPKGVLMEKYNDKNIRRIKAAKLLTWLRENGHTTIVMADIAYQKQQLTNLMKFVDMKEDLLDTVSRQQDKQGD